MNKIKHLPMALLALYLLKITALGANYADALVITAISSLIAFSLKKDKEEELEKIEQLIKVQGEIIVKLEKELGELRTHIATAKIGAQFKGMTGVR